MKICYIIDSLAAGGKERQLVNLISGLSSKNEILVIVFNDYIFFKELLNMPVELIVFKREKRNSLKTIIKVYKELNRFKPQITHIWDNISHCIALPYIIIRKTIVINSSIRYGGIIKRNLKARFVQRLAYFTAKKVISNSKQGLIVEKLEKSKNAKYIYNGFDINLFENKLYEYGLKWTMDIPLLKPAVIMVARFYSAKDYITFIKAAKILIKKSSEIGFYCIGNGPMKDLAENESGEYLGKNIFFLGNISNIQILLPQFTIGLLLNNTNGHAEGISNAIMEYMAAGLPVIATNAGGTSELIEDGLSGFLVPSFDENAVAHRIEELLNSSDLRHSMGKRGKEIIRNKFSIEKMINSYTSQYNKLINE